MQKFITVIFILIGMGLHSIHAQNQTASNDTPDLTAKVVTQEIKVSGVCNMCKKRIEQAALIKGVKMAEWNKDTQKLKVIYSGKKTSEKAICEAVAAVGHDAGKVKAKDAIYSELPDCCQYRDGVKVH